MHSGACSGISERANRAGEVQFRRKHFRDTDRKVFKAENTFTVDVNSYQKTDTIIYNYSGTLIDLPLQRMILRFLEGQPRVASWFLGMKVQSVGFGLSTATELLGRVLKIFDAHKTCVRAKHVSHTAAPFQLKRKVSL